MSNNLYFHEIVAGAGNSRAMEAETIQKNEASPKSHMSRGNFLRNILLLIVFVASLISPDFDTLRKYFYQWFYFQHFTCFCDTHLGVASKKKQ